MECYTPISWLVCARAKIIDGLSLVYYAYNLQEQATQLLTCVQVHRF